MKCLAWNCRGLGNPRSVRALKELMHKEDPHVVFLSETKLHDSKIDRVKRCCGMDACIGVSANGKSGGLAMMWKKEAKLHMLSFSVNHIDMMVEAEPEKIWWIKVSMKNQI